MNFLVNVKIKTLIRSDPHFHSTEKCAKYRKFLLRLHCSLLLCSLLLPWLHCTHQNRRYHAVHLTRSSPAPTISSLLHRARVLLHTGAWASAALLTYLLTKLQKQLLTYLLTKLQKLKNSNSSTLAHQVALIESCTQRVHDWLLNNGLHLNPTKSEAIAFSIQGPNHLRPWQNPLHPSQ